MREIVVCGIPFGTDKEKEALKFVKDNGFSSVQIYTFWKKFEPEKRGKFDWSFYDRQVESIGKFGLKWVPFFLMGPAYSSPLWYLSSSLHRGLICLEHNKENPVESIWNEKFHNEVSRVLSSFSEHYLPWNIIESILIGICGDYGEAIFPVLGNWPGAYHTHRGYWCGDSDAIDSFRKYLKNKYEKIDRLNKSWRAYFRNFEEIKPFLKHKAVSQTAFFDLLKWYKDSMTEYSEFWLKETKRYFSKIPVYLCTGGMGEPEHGSCFSSQAKVASKYKCGIRLTNEGNNFYDNFYLTCHMFSACKFYGSYMGLEPVGPMLPEGVLTRMFGTIAYGNRQIFHYYSNFFKDGKETGAIKYVKKYKDLIKERKKEIKIAFFWPIVQSNLEGKSISENIKFALTFIRKRYEVMALDEVLILDGALKDKKILIMIDVQYTQKEVLEKIAEWVNKGGVILTNIRTVDIEENNVKDFDNIFGIEEVSEECWGHCNYYTTGVKWANRFNKVEKIHSERGWNKLSKNVIPLAKTTPHIVKDGMPVGEIYLCFENNFGRGRGIFYSGPLDLNIQPDAIFTPTKSFEFLFYDLCENFSGIKPFKIFEDEIAKVEIGRKTYILKETEILIE